jgi:hypothetical protein
LPRYFRSNHDPLDPIEAHFILPAIVELRRAGLAAFAVSLSPPHPLGFSLAPSFVIGLGEDPDSLGHANSPSEIFDLNTAFDTGAAFSTRFFGSGRE